MARLGAKSSLFYIYLHIEPEITSAVSFAAHIWGHNALEPDPQLVQISIAPLHQLKIWLCTSLLLLVSMAQGICTAEQTRATLSTDK